MNWENTAEAPSVWHSVQWTWDDFEKGFILIYEGRSFLQPLSHTETVQAPLNCAWTVAFQNSFITHLSQNLFLLWIP